MSDLGDLLLGIAGCVVVAYMLWTEFLDAREDRAAAKQHEIELAAAHARFLQGLDLREADRRGLAG